MKSEEIAQFSAALQRFAIDRLIMSHSIGPKSIREYLFIQVILTEKKGSVNLSRILQVSVILFNIIM